jgi:hypothetical protein
VGKTRLSVGRIKITSEITRTSDLLTYAVFHTGDHNINCAVREDGDLEGYARMAAGMRTPFEHGDIPEMIRLMDRHFGAVHYSVEHLFRDEQREILEEILRVPGEEIFNTLRHITERYAPLRHFMTNLRAPPLRSLAMAVEIVLNSELQEQFGREVPDVKRIREILDECAATKVTLYTEKLAYVLKRHLDRVGENFMLSPQDLESLTRFASAAELAGAVPFQVNLWKPQNIYHEMLTGALSEMRRCAEQGNQRAGAWVENFLVLGQKLGFAAAAPSQ